MYRFALIFPALILIAGFAQQSSNPPAAKTPTYAAIPVEATKQPNPVKYTPESLARAKKWWTLDCEMCHGKNGDGKGDTAKEMKLQIADFTIPLRSKIAPMAKSSTSSKMVTTICLPRVHASRRKRIGIW